MKFYRRDLEINERQEMHLEVDHYLEPIEITEEEIRDIITMEYYGHLQPGPGELVAWIEDSAKDILSKLKGE